MRGFGRSRLRWKFYIVMARSAGLTSVAASGRAWEGGAYSLSGMLMFQVTPDVFLTSESL